MSSETSDWSIYRRLLSYTHWGAFMLSVFGFILYSLANVSVLQVISYLVDSLQGTSSMMSSRFSEVFRDWFGAGADVDQTMVPIAIVLIVMLRGLGTFIGNYFISYASTNMVHNLRCELFDQILRLPSGFYDRNALGHLVTKVTFHVTQVTGAATEAVKIVIREGFTVIGYLAFLLYLNWKLTLIFFTVAPIIAVLVGYAGRRFRRISERIQVSMGEVTHVASEATQGYREVRTFGGGDYERERFLAVSNANRRQSMKMVVTQSINTPVVQVLVSVALAALVWLVLDPSIRGTMSTGDIVAFISTGGLLAKPIRQLSEVNATIQKGLAAAKDIFTMFDEPIEHDEGHVKRARVSGKIEFRNVTFGYEVDEPVLKGVSFVANPGETIALVGKSGSGKSTLAGLIPRFYHPQGGEILVDDTPLNDYELANLRSHMAIVSQQVTLFNDSIRRNIAYGGLHDAGDAEIIAAARKAFAWDFIERLDEGLDTVVGDDGVLLSGGQRQRLAIARAFLKDAPILILDEATSALDAESERQIQAALDAVVEGRTTIVIAHRLSTIEKADRILVVDDGQIVEEGTHETLLAERGHYARFYRDGDMDEGGPPPEETRQAAPPAVSLPAWRSDVPVLQRAWYEGHAWVRVLSPLSFLYRQITAWRRNRIESGGRAWSAPVPVVVVGNISVGGTGKTPLVAMLAERFLSRGLKPGIVSRGYGATDTTFPRIVDATSDPRASGDEPVMLARKTGVPVVIDPDRVNAVRYLLETADCDVVISDDGLQHYALARNVEIAVVDGQRGLGNGLCLPAGPLREPPSRLKDVDFVVVNGETTIDLGVPMETMTLAASRLTDLATGDALPASVDSIGATVHGVAGIGNPDRFFDTLRQLGFNVIEHGYPDHHPFDADDLVFDDGLPVVVTEKDAVKLRALGLDTLAQVWVLGVEAELPEVFVTSVLAKAGLNVTALRVIPGRVEEAQRRP